ncbi:hypothetical protein FRX31_030677 [Thalictrum thalictroides]|uniref:Wall-associated receptor kinase-like n=1 Tax=Thalictrum thalictroides TaxID=46969 RepID=A0A7J6V3V2_THATH|nr:hypothetical protein FRX31_030677 [Thalictrum thalictroides]
MVKEGKTKQVSGVAELAMRCLNLKGEMRPSTKEVAAELEWFRGSGSMSENPQISKESARSIMDIAKRCLNLKGEIRKVTTELEWFRGAESMSGI